MARWGSSARASLRWYTVYMKQTQTDTKKTLVDTIEKKYGVELRYTSDAG